MKKNKSFSIIESISSLARKNRWQLSYDTDSDYLYWTEKNIAKDSKLKKLSREVSFYINKSGNPEGLMIQCFKNNFLTQNQDVSDIYKLFVEKDKDNLLVIPREKRGEANAIMSGFAESIKKDIYKDALEAEYTIKDLENIIAVR